MINCVTMSSVTATNHQLRSGRRRSWKEGSGIIASTWTLGKPRRWWSTTAGSSLSLSPLPINGTPVDSISYLQDYLPEDLTWSTHTHTHAQISKARQRLYQRWLRRFRVSTKILKMAVVESMLTIWTSPRLSAAQSTRKSCREWSEQPERCVGICPDCRMLTPGAAAAEPSK